MSTEHVQPGERLARRELLRRLLGATCTASSAGLLGHALRAATVPLPRVGNDRPPGPDFAPRARRVLFLFMPGGVSHVDALDWKPKLKADHGKPWKETSLKAPVWDFLPNRQCGTEVSELFPRLRDVMHEVCLVRSMVADHGDHFQATLGMHTGSVSFARPSLGAWVSWALGTDNRNLPGHVVIAPKLPYAGAQVWSADFLPACHQGVRVVPGPMPLPDLDPAARTPALQALEDALLDAQNARHLAARGGDPQLEGRIASLATARGMEREAPEVFDLRRESDAVLELYGLERGKAEGFAWQCLVARRMLERGVRFVEVIDVGASHNWDSHGDMQDHAKLAKAIDQPIGALLRDLRARGLLDDTLVVWATEFGRTPFLIKDSPAAGRGHHRAAFSCWLAGGGARAGSVFGASDELGIEVARDPVRVRDFHATILNLLGLDHDRLTYRYGGRDERLTDVGGKVMRGLMA